MNTELIKIDTNVPTKEDVKQASARIAELVAFGEMSAIEAHLKLSIAKDIAEDAMKQIKPYVSSEIDSYGKEKPVIAGWEIANRYGGNTAKFDHNPEWVRLKTELTALEEKMKSAAKGMTIVDDATGEVIHPAVFVPRADSVTVIFKNK